MPPDVLATICDESTPQQCSESAVRARNLLFVKEPDALWCIDAGKDSAKITWKKNLANGMKLTLGSLTMVCAMTKPMISIYCFM